MTVVAGAIDLPVDGQVVGAVLSISGWALIDGRPANLVEVFVDGRPAIRARRAEVREDLAVALDVDAPIGRAAGFHELVELGDPVTPGGEITVTVRAEGRGGHLWTSEPVRVVRRAGHPAAPLPGPTPLLDPAFAERPPRSLPARPRVCVFTHSLRVGGGELYLQELLLRLVEADAATFLVVSPEDGPLRAELEAAGIAVHIAGAVPVEADRYVARVAELATLLVAWGAHVVVANTLGTFGYVDAALVAGRPVIWAIHESFPLDVFAYLNWHEHLDPEVRARLDATLAGADVVVFEADATRALYAEQVPALRGRHVRYGIDLDAVAAYERAHDRARLRRSLGIGVDDRVLLVMGVFQDRKAQLALVHAYAELAATHPDAVLVLVGYHPSPYGEAVRRTVDELGLGGSIRIEDIHPDTYRWYRVADVLVSAADIESLPRSILEAMAFGVPVAAASVFGVPEVVVDGENGWLFEPRHGGALTAALHRVLVADDAELAALGARARLTAEAFDGQGYAAEYHKLIVELSSGEGDG